MTFEEKIKELLIGNGLSETGAAAVIQTAKEDDVLEPMAQRWQDDIEGYPPSMLSVLWFSIKQIALQYIDETCPLAWYRPMFESGAET